MEQENIKELLDKFKAGAATEAEVAFLELWYAQYKDEEGPEYQLSDRLGDANEIWSNLPVHEQAARRIALWPRVVAVAAAVTAIALCVYFFNSGKYQDAGMKTGSTKGVDDVAPGKNGATITLANGKVIQLSDQQTGVVIGAELKYADGSVVRYSSGSQFSGSQKGSQKTTGPVGVRSLATGSEVQNLTASTAKGQTYQFTLPDGTKVWLNAESSIGFPSQFNGKERKIVLSGEAYFAVVHDARQPFRVESKGQIVEDIGTEFNINAYTDEGEIRTTLVEGSAQVNGVVLKPNQQAINASANIKVQTVDAADVVAWKEGLFVFNDEPLQSVMKKVARWYNVEVVYDGADRNYPYGGSVSRYDNVSKVLKRLELAGGVHFKIEGRRIIAMK